MAAVTICSDFGAQKENKVSHCFPVYFLWSDGTRCHDLSFLNVESKSFKLVSIEIKKGKKNLFVKEMTNTRNSKKIKHEDVKKGQQNHKTWTPVRKYKFFNMCLSLYNYQSKSSRYRQGYLKTRATTNQKHKIDSPKPKRREHKHKKQGKHHTTERRVKPRKNKEQTGKQGLIWQWIHMYQ